MAYTAKNDQMNDGSIAANESCNRNFYPFGSAVVHNIQKYKNNLYAPCIRLKYRVI